MIIQIMKTAATARFTFPITIGCLMGCVDGTAATFASLSHSEDLTATISGFSSEFQTPDRRAQHVVNGNGLDSSVPPNHGVNPNGFMWLNSGDGTFAGGNPASDPDRPGQLAHITFDLGDLYFVDSFRVWNYNEVNINNNQSFTNRGVQTLTVSTASTVGGPFTPLVDPSDADTTFLFAQAPGSSTYTGQLFTFASPFQTQYVRFDIKTNYGDANDFVGLSEVRFTGSLVPEPSSMLLLTVGVSGAMLLCKRRQL